METTKKSCLGVTLLLFLLLVSAVHGAQVADAKYVQAAAGDGERVTVRTGHGHGYSSHSGGHPNGGTPEPEQGGAGVVDPRNLNGRSQPRRGAATRALGYSSGLICTLVGVVMLLLL